MTRAYTFSAQQHASVAQQQERDYSVYSSYGKNIHYSSYVDIKNTNSNETRRENGKENSNQPIPLVDSSTAKENDICVTGGFRPSKFRVPHWSLRSRFALYSANLRLLKLSASGSIQSPISYAATLSINGGKFTSCPRMWTLLSVRKYIQDHCIGEIIAWLLPDLIKSINVVTTINSTQYDPQTLAQAQTITYEALDCFFKTVASQIEKHTLTTFRSILLWAWE
ncbi:hypothetical protein BDK51DRAFT_26347 [Blyttiomyces helicus]|uniref:Uncharacterized protein n=1 Tax=Blyttiomyces helicus TaxID=388810 RepID=A0A4P9WME2_9FUNG|nr:hypothetical protein BDK51DRAFT_26347 [Blyttiomyces helicus]|eukprot:RKO94241.1 hypothetical protein BDK51DRAFT_26347 [Blyttiomyces helicus]